MELTLFLLYAAALTGQLFDAYTTGIGLDRGFREANPVVRWLVARLGFSVVQLIKAGLLPSLFIPVAAWLGNEAGVTWLAILAAGGWVAGTINAVRLRRAGISIGWFRSKGST